MAQPGASMTLASDIWLIATWNVAELGFGSTEGQFFNFGSSQQCYVTLALPDTTIELASQAQSSSERGIEAGNVKLTPG